MSNPSKLKRTAASLRIAYFALLFMTMTAATLHLGTSTAHAAQASLSWTAPTTNTDGTPITNLSGYQLYTGTVSGSYSQNINVGNVTSYSLSNLNDATTYYFAVTANDAAGDVSGYSNQATYTTPAVPPASALYTLTATAGSGGSITPSGSMVVSQGASQTYAVTPNANYYIASVSVDGAVVSSNVTTYSYTFSNVAANHTLSATFAATASTTAGYTITASAGANGSISPTATVTKGASQTFTATPNTGYYVVSVVVDGTTVASNIPKGGYSYTFSNVTASHTISATFGIGAYNLVTSAGTGGSISPENAWVNYNTSQTVTVTPNTGYYVVSVVVDGTTVASNIPKGGYSYTFSNVTAGHTISATFALGAYNIVASGGTGGSVSPTSPWVTYGTSQTFTITPSANHKISKVTVDGVSVGAVSSYTFQNVTTAHTIAATFQ